jgi:thiamine pyrophosphate-dependent acetolactate synthase large subunit-like protein
MARSVADLLVETLAVAGVERVYGLPGDSLNGFTDAIRRQGKCGRLSGDECVQAPHDLQRSKFR